MVELGFEVVVGVEDALHVFVSLPFGFEEALFGSVELVFVSLYLVLELSPLAGEEVLVLSKHIDFSSEGFTPSFDIVLAFLHLCQLGLKGFRLILIVLFIDFELSYLFKVVLLLNVGHI